MGIKDLAALPKHMLIDGKLVAASRTYPSISPSTGEVLGEAPDASEDDVRAAVAAARRAFDETDWATNVQFRLRCLQQLHAALVKHKEELRELTIADVGAPRGTTYGAQLDEPVDIVEYYAGLLSSFSFTEELGLREFMGKQHKRWIEKEPVGVVAAIIGYNYPNQLTLAKLPPALAAGCTVVLKTAPQTPLITLAIAELIANETDIPAGVVNVISGSSPAVGQVLTTSPDVDAITFTGSTATGRKIMAAGAETIKRVFLELGGKSALVVLDDADTSMLPLTAAFTACSHAGQGCAITTRLVVPRDSHDEIVAGVAAAMGNVKYGDPFDQENYMGPLITEEQRDKVHGLVERAVADGATLVCGGKKTDGPGYYYEPTLLANVDPDSEVAQTEAFGPVLVVIPHDGDDDAVKIANNSIYGLSGGVLSASEDRALAVARKIRTGTIGINGGAWFGADSPFGGFKQSGIGREMGVLGLEEFLESKTLAAPVAAQ
ncbi:MAG: aldehyde dehydrogenase family protein [Streptosporangiales bacterium]|nr:aldehyde dehydrogenase family protein [Streptosporangiales bacterium]